ncbi:MAG: SdiA-regulated domain-containing protein [Pirellulales bacterium]|nr:SdiA-regulated domain-containing protein [Pirellulales bacterium]
MNLEKEELGLPEDVRQAEGVTRTRKGGWLICSEPNRIYCFV